jgi:2-oxoglutarate dehydrogenase E2 component (dihydrolipoamide succinyltransferase)
MSVSVTMPRLGESVTEGTVTRWLKKEGERVEADEPLLEVSTDKVDTEIPAPASGTLSAIRVGEDETVEVGVELAVIDEGGSAAAPRVVSTASFPATAEARRPGGGRSTSVIRVRRRRCCTKPIWIFPAANAPPPGTNRHAARTGIRSREVRRIDVRTSEAKLASTTSMARRF